MPNSYLSVSKHFLWWLSRLVVVLAAVWPTWVLQASPSYRIEKGVLDLRNWDPQRDPIIELKGEAEFYWEQFIVSAPRAGADPQYLEMSLPWNRDGRFPALGFASYRVRILLPNRTQGLGMTLVGAVTRARVFINHELQYTFGEPLSILDSTYESTQVYSRKPKHIPIPSQESEIELVYEASNWESPLNGGFRRKVSRIGLTHALEDNLRKQLGLETSLIAVCFVMGIYHLFLFALRSDDKSNLFFTLMTIAVALNLTAINESEVIELVLPSWHYNHRILLFNLGWQGTSVACFYFVANIFPAEVNKKFAHLFAIATLFFSALVIFSVPAQYIKFLGIFQLMCVSLIGYTLVSVVRALRRKPTEARIFLGIIGVFGIATVNDMFLMMGKLNTPALTMYGILIFILGQSALLSMRFAQAFRQVQILSDEIIEKEKARTVFFHNTSHELRTPLNGILGFLDLVRGGHYGPVPDKARIQIDKAWRLAESLKLQVNTILDLAKSKRGDLRLTMNVIDLAQLKKDCDVLAEGLQLKFPGTQYASQLDDIAGTRRWNGDREKILTMIRNLLGNAFKFRSPDRPNQVRLVIEHRQGELLIRVSDQGIGIAPENQTKIFDEFSQAQSDARRSYEGTGLGLAMVRDLVKLSQGTVQVESTLNKGSLFFVKLPELSRDIQAQAEEANDGAITVSEVNEDGGAVHSLAAGHSAAIHDFASQFRLLVVDDNSSNLEVIQDILSLDGYQIELADGGKKALQSLDEAAPDLLILDLMMPEVSGEDVLRTVRSTPRLKDLPIIILTARASDQDRIASLGLGADEYMSKPFDPRELSLRVYNTIERRELQRQALDSEHRQRLSELGALFTDLSHELKNIFQLPHAKPQELAQLFPELWSRPDLPVPAVAALQKAFEMSRRGSNRLASFDQMQQQAKQRWPGENRRRAARILAFSSLDDPTTLELWKTIHELPAESFASLQDQLDMSDQFIDFQLALYRGRDLALSALDLERMGHSQGQSILREVIASIQTLMQARFRKSGVELRSDVPPLDLPMAPGVLQQVLINLLGNACDVMAKEPMEKRWIEIAYREHRDSCELRIRNGGPKIDESIAKQIFRRGFSTKGQQGTGLGLSLSQRLVREQGANLSLDLKDEHTTFVISFVKKKEEKLA
ncbi:MAG TPA: ATP-binding protein [Oligoflexus sp.]|uniref:ATP-binding protein n=1 Tax=Oligoflexus sp. TaxID=1971216 RepID=UPI002D6F9CC9|nr:ATP-binding protein [Oligoflexus sp.]HYX35250.1 ATP-binding protein [Oligoflexus sp.]